MQAYSGLVASKFRHGGEDVDSRPRFAIEALDRFFASESRFDEFGDLFGGQSPAGP
jgi:hypothetical protein